MSTITSDSKKTVIVGAGIGGMTLAAMHSLHGLSCEVYERSKNISEDGFGLNIQPAAVSTLYRLGLADELDSVGIRTGVHLYTDHLGATLFEEKRGLSAGFGTPQISIRRSDLLNLLFKKAKVGSTTFRFDESLSSQEINKISQSSNINQQSKFLMVGADGFNSTVRNTIFPDAMDLNSGQTILWRGITSMPRLLDGKTMIIANDDAGVRLIAYPVSHIHDLRGESLINWVLLVPGLSPSSPDANSSQSQISNYLLGLLHSWRFDWLDLKALVTKSIKLMRTEMVDREPIDRWSNKLIVLLGDAAHPMFPIGANGATQSIIDAEILADVLFQSNDLNEAINKYEHKRISKVSNIVRENRDMNNRELASRNLKKKEKIKELIDTVTTYKLKTTK